MDCSPPGSSLSMGFPRQESWSRQPCPPSADLPDPGIEPKSPAPAGGFFFTEQPGKLFPDALQVGICGFSPGKPLSDALQVGICGFPQTPISIPFQVSPLSLAMLQTWGNMIFSSLSPNFRSLGYACLLIWKWVRSGTVPGGSILEV